MGMLSYSRKVNDSHLLSIGVYVDDLTVTSANSTHIQEFKAKMMKSFEMSNLWQLNSYLGVEVIQEKHIFL